MATHPNDSSSQRKNVKKTPIWKFFTPIFGILLLVIGGLYGIKATLPPPATPQAQSDNANRNDQLAHLSLTQLDGKSIQISEMKGKIFLLNFWATWCEACIEEMPSIVKLKESYKDQGFEVLGINVDENPDAVVPRAMRQLGLNFPIFKDPEGSLAEMFDVHAIPLTVIIRKSGEVLISLDGGRDWNSPEMRAKLERWLNG